jgi:threonine/homoserine efflux transporter RhtA
MNSITGSLVMTVLFAGIFLPVLLLRRLHRHEWQLLGAGLAAMACSIYFELFPLGLALAVGLIGFSLYLAARN